MQSTYSRYQYTPPNLLQSIASELDVEDPANLEARLRALAELAKSAPDSFEETSDQTIAFLLKDVLAIAPENVSPVEHVL